MIDYADRHQSLLVNQYLVGPLHAILLQSKKTGTRVIQSTTDDTTAAANAAAAAETAVVFINSDSGEG